MAGGSLPGTSGQCMEMAFLPPERGPSLGGSLERARLNCRVEVKIKMAEILGRLSLNTEDGKWGAY